MSEPPLAPPYPAGSAEAAEWLKIRARNEQRHHALHGHSLAVTEARGGRPLIHRGYLLIPAAASLEEHARGVATISAAGRTLFADTSEHQGLVNFGVYRASGLRGIGYKATEGRTYLDGQCIRNRDQALATDTKALAYHFAFWSQEYAGNPSLWGAQVEWFLTYAPSAHAHCLDVEMLAAAGSFIDVRAMVNAYRTHYATHPLLIYTNRGLWLNRSKVPYNAPVGTLLWHAGYRDGQYAPTQGTLGQQWAALTGTTNSMSGLGFTDAETLIYQFTDHAAVPGIGSLCDGNALEAPVTDWDRLLVTGEDDMSAADVKAITDWIGGNVPALVQAEVRKALKTDWVNADALTDDPSAQISPVGMILQAFERGPREILGTAVDPAHTAGQALAAAVAQTDTVEASLAAVLAALQGISDKLGTGQGGALTKADVEAAVADAIAGYRYVPEQRAGS